ncbi:MAG: prephenate dehydratase [Sulfurospirillaceae bacterium]|jgi:prephenate dehydratase|nr:prephenate dehydratase [Sulfurospirillaceae bacterium]MCK9545916.1 prephenate dehydratase [Sulfurospirillaceae bacterium]
MNDLIIAYQGVEGAYSHLACKNAYPKSLTIACDTFADAMKLVESGTANLAMIPVENSTAGRVEEMYRLIPELKLNIVKEHFEPVRHCLLGVQGSSLKSIKTVASHPQALAQCYKNISKYGFKAEAKFDTAGSAKEIKKLNDPTKAAIASKLAAKLYDLVILDENFGDKIGNTTRFIVLSNESTTPKYDKKEEFITSLVFNVRDIPAALYKALGGFATNGVNLLKLESYSPKGDLKVSQFHLDIDSHPHHPSFILALEELSFFAKDIKFLGTYRKDSYRVNI